VHLDETMTPEASAFVHTAGARVPRSCDDACRVDRPVTQLLQRRVHEPGSNTCSPCTLGNGDGEDLGGWQPFVLCTTSVAQGLPDSPRRPNRGGGGNESGEDPVVPQELAVDAARVLSDSNISDDTVVIVDDQYEPMV